jgi:hypothetical protein
MTGRHICSINSMEQILSRRIMISQSQEMSRLVRRQIIRCFVQITCLFDILATSHNVLLLFL